ncbi:M23 family metallopeptidase [Streptomyces sp. NPDC051546]|uniref:M23 family metallopeptidase n=1 Tax=Streptomyces sp. NPDC051546 TaxID=3365655 RepID=UPI0037A09CA8
MAYGQTHPGAVAAVQAEAAEQITPVIVEPTTLPLPVKGTDGRIHLVYELDLMNMSTLPAMITGMSARAAGGNLLEELRGQALLGKFRPSGTPAQQAPKDTILQPGQQGRVWLDVIVPLDAGFPLGLDHDVSVSYPKALGIIPSSMNESVASMRIPDRRPVVLRPPLDGDGWLDANGCCSTITAHRSSASPINGQAHFGERFAIDFVRLDEQGALFHGPADKVRSYRYYAAPVHAAADGRIVAVVDQYPDKKPGSATPDMPLDEYSGNHVVEELASGEYLLYAHLEPGSTRGKVSPGQVVKAGTVLGDLGSSGNSDAPHLHFEVMSGRSPFTSEGLPFVFSSFDLQGTVTPDALDKALGSGSGRVAVGAERGRSARVQEMPLYLDVVKFP